MKQLLGEKMYGLATPRYVGESVVRELSLSERGAATEVPPLQV
jgi:Arc/MetJ family transcription regulator